MILQTYSFTCLFQIRIDKLVDKWSGSIEIGVTTHNPNNLDYPATMTNLRSGTLFIINKHFSHNYLNVHSRYIYISDAWCGLEVANVSDSSLK